MRFFMLTKRSFLTFSILIDACHEFVDKVRTSNFQIGFPEILGSDQTPKKFHKLQLIMCVCILAKRTKD